MPDLQTEIFKKVLPNMNNLKFDDPGEEQEVIVETAPQTTNITKSLWEYIKAHPNQTLAPIVKAFPNLERTGISTRLTQMRKRGNLIATPSNQGFLYSVSSDTYSALSNAEAIEKANEARRAKLKQREIRAKIKAAKSKAMKPTAPAPKAVARPEVTPRTSVASLLDTMSIVQARELYDQLKKIFGGDFHL